MFPYHFNLYITISIVYHHLFSIFMLLVLLVDSKSFAFDFYLGGIPLSSISTKFNFIVIWLSHTIDWLTHKPLHLVYISYSFHWHAIQTRVLACNKNKICTFYSNQTSLRYEKHEADEHEILVNSDSEYSFFLWFLSKQPEWACIYHFVYLSIYQINLNF